MGMTGSDKTKQDEQHQREYRAQVDHGGYVLREDSLTGDHQGLAAFPVSQSETAVTWCYVSPINDERHVHQAMCLN